LVSAMVYESFQDINLNTLEGRNPLSSEEIALGNICLIEMNLTIGDYIEINLDGTHMKKMLIVGSFQGFYNMGRGARILGSTLDEYKVNYVYDGCSVILKDGVDKQLFIERMEKEYGEYVKIIDRKNLYKNIMNMICEPQEAAITPLVYITAIIGAVNLFYIIYANNVKKKKTYAIYKSIGYPAGKLVLVNCIYVGLIGVVSIAVAILSLIYIFPQIMVLSMSSFGFAEYKLVFHPELFLYVNITLFIIFIGTTILSSKDLWKNQLNEIVNE
jgi:putative ABC transport system permease protein